jgi:hypothetical protein
MRDIRLMLWQSDLYLIGLASRLRTYYGANMTNRTPALMDELMPSAVSTSDAARRDDLAGARAYLLHDAERETRRSWTRIVAGAFAAGFALTALALAGNAMVNSKLAADLFATDAPLVQGDVAPTTTTTDVAGGTNSPSEPLTSSGTGGSAAAFATQVDASDATNTTPDATTASAPTSGLSATTGGTAAANSNTGSATNTNNGGGGSGSASGGSSGSGGSSAAIVVGSAQRSASETFAVGNVSPDTAIRTDFAGGVVGDVVPVDVQSVDGNTMAGARIELCVRRAGASCAAGANGTSVVRWTAVITNAAPIITAADGNGSWGLFVRSRTGTADTPSTTLGFDVTIGSQAQSANDWVVETTTVDEGGLGKTAVGAPATVSASRTRASGSSFLSALWPF